ncbi:hypothetical protein TNCV_263801 [Trichonephila clavipes]|nr:hypothetical protein TNCV_263801 [Trichonephila clavipes]
MQMTLVDGRTQTTEILTTSVDIGIQGKVIAMELITLENAKGNRTLLGIDFFTAAGIVLETVVFHGNIPQKIQESAS